ncbi:MAG TPA: HdeD family acid-resistance protein [Beijerinckiaceae bacterium]|nr:HdeD family acid-resistance protein [Beijerinckiaceae bacterium]
MCAQLAQNWWAVALRGVFGILFGLVALVLPGATILSLVLFFSAYMLVDGIFGIIAAVRAARGGERWGMLVFEGILNIAVGVIAFVMPGLTVVAFVLLLAAWSLVSGGLMLGAAFRLSQHHGRWWMALAGIASIIFGILLAIAPIIGAVVLTWWIGAYALLFGVVLLVLAFRLRAMNDAGRRTAAPRAA